MADEKDWKSILNRKVPPLISTKQLYVNNRWYQLWPKIKRLDSGDTALALREFVFLMNKFFAANDPHVNKKIDNALKHAIQKHIVDNPEVWPLENVQKPLFTKKESLVHQIDKPQRMGFLLTWIQRHNNFNYPHVQQFFDRIYEKIYYTFADQFLVTLNDAEAGFIVQQLNFLVGTEPKVILAMTEVEKLKQQLADAKTREPFIKITAPSAQLDREFLWHEFFAKLIRLELKDNVNSAASRAIRAEEKAARDALVAAEKLYDLERNEYLESRHNLTRDIAAKQASQKIISDFKEELENWEYRAKIAKVHSANIINSDINNAMLLAMRRVVGWIQNLKPYDEKFHQLVQKSFDESLDRSRQLKENVVNMRDLNSDRNFTKFTQRVYGQTEQDWISTFLNKFSESQIKAVIKQAMDYYHRDDFAYFAANVVQPFYDIPAAAVAALSAIPIAVAPLAVAIDVKNADAKSLEQKNPGSAYAATGRPIRPVGLRQPVTTREFTAVQGLNLTGGHKAAKCTCPRFAVSESRLAVPWTSWGRYANSHLNWR